MRPPHLAHAAFANQGGDFVGTDAGAGSEGHVRAILRQAVAASGLSRVARLSSFSNGELPHENRAVRN